MSKSFISAVVGACALLATPALAADMIMPTKAPIMMAAPSPWDIAFGGALMSDYNFRGISQSDRGPAVGAYFEPRYNITPSLQLYAGIAGTSVRLPQTPSAEIDLYAGIRPTLGMFNFDFGAIYYWYPSGQLILYPNGNFSLADQSYWELYGKVSTTFADIFTVGANLYWFDSWLNTGANGTYVSATAKVALPAGSMPFGWYISGELGRLTLGTTRTIFFGPPVNVLAAPVALPDYTTWNIGVGFTWKVFTLDLRYYDTDLSRASCNALTGDPGAGFVAPGVIGSKWCSDAFIAKLSFDMTLANLR